MKPALLVNPSLGGFEARLAESYDVAHWPQDAARAGDIAAALVIGGVGLPNDVIAALPNLKLIACLGAGYDGIDAPFARARGVTLTNCPNINNEDVADLAMGLMLSVARHIAHGDRNVRSGAWREGVLTSSRFSGRKLGIVGLGAIGRAIAARGTGFRLETRWTGPRSKPDAPYPYEPSLLKLAEWADILVVACPAAPGTEKMIDAAVIEALGPRGMLINIARGSLVDEAALIDALKRGKLGGAGLDVFAQEPTDAARWRDLPNVTLTPHIGGGAREALLASFALVQENLRRFFAGEPVAPETVVAGP